MVAFVYEHRVMGSDPRLAVLFVQARNEATAFVIACAALRRCIREQMNRSGAAPWHNDGTLLHWRSLGMLAHARSAALI